MGMTSLTGLQSHAIPYVQSTKSIVMISPTASGKTLSYLLPVMGNLTPDYGFTKVKCFVGYKVQMYSTCCSGEIQ